MDTDGKLKESFAGKRESNNGYLTIGIQNGFVTVAGEESRLIGIKRTKKKKRKHSLIRISNDDSSECSSKVVKIYG